MIKSSFIRKCLFIAFMGNVILFNVPILAAAEIDQEEISPDFEYEIYAKENNVSISEAKERFLAMNEAAEIADILTSKYLNFALFYIEHDPTFEIVFNFKQDSLIPSEFNELIKDKSWASRSTIRRVKYSLSDLKFIQNQASQALDTYEGAEYLIAIDVKENQIRADIPPEMAMKMAFRNNTERAASPIPQGVKLNYVNKLPQPVSRGVREIP